MKRRPVVYLPSAERDLSEAVDYIHRDSPSAAEAWLDRIDKALSRLGAFPESGVKPKDPRLASLGYRMLVIDEHIAFYIVSPAAVEVRRVLHGRRRYSFLL